MTTVTAQPTPQPDAAAIDPDKKLVDDTGLLERLGNLKALGGLESTLADQVKALLFEHGAKRIESTSYAGQIAAGGSDAGEVDVKKFLALCRRKKVKQRQIDEAIKIVKDRVTFLSADEIAACSVPGKPRPWRLIVERRKDLPAASLSCAIDALAEDSRAGKLPERAARK